MKSQLNEKGHYTLVCYYFSLQNNKMSAEKKYQIDKKSFFLNNKCSKPDN
jgi:hypothetical protein